MPLNAVFLADFSSFKAATDEAVAKLKTFDDNANKVAGSLSRMGDSLSGVKTIQQATVMAKAVDEIGGISKLTASELQRLGSQAAEAIEKMQKTGITDIPKNLQDIADAAAKAAKANTDAATAAAQSGASWGKSITDWSNGIAAGVASGQLLADVARRTVGALVDLGEEAFQDASHVRDLSQATGLSTDAIQRFGYVTKDFGVSTDEIARGVDELSAKLASGDKSAVGAVTGLGLSFQKLIAAGPQEAFLQVVDATNRIADPMLRASERTDIFGAKLGRVIGQLPDLRAALDAVPKDAIVSEQAIKSLDDFAERLGHIKDQLKAGLAEDISKVLNAFNLGTPTQTPTGPTFGRPLNGVPNLASTGAPSLSIAVAPSTSEAITQLQTRIAALAAEYRNLTDAQKQTIALGEQAGVDEADIAAKLGIHVETVKRYEQAEKDAADATKTSAEQAKALKTAHEALVAKLVDVEHGLDAAGLGFAKLDELGEKVKITLPTIAQEIDALGRAGEHSGAALLKLGGALAGGPGALADVQIGGIGTLPDVSPGVDVAGELDTLKTKTDTWHTSLQNTSLALSQLATVGGDSFRGVVQDLSTAVESTNALDAGFKALSSSGGGFEGLVGKASGALTLVSGAASLLEGIGKALNIGGPSDAEKQSRKDRTSAFQQAGLTLDDKGIQAAEDALTQLGVKGTQAQQIVARALDAKTPAAFAAAMKPVNDALSFQAAVQKNVTAVSTMVGAFQNAGHVLPASMVETIKTLAKLPGLTNDERDALNGLVASAAPNFANLEGIAEKYGGTLQGLGPKLAQGQIDDTAKGIFQDFQDLTNAGGEAGNVIGLMQGKLGDLVKEAEDNGAAVPSFLKDILGNFGDTIKDSQGDIVDLTKVKFDDTPTTNGLDDMQAKLGDVQDLLQNGVPDALNTLLAQIPNNPFAGWQVPNLPAAPSASASHASTGGIVTPTGVQHFAGGGKVLQFPGAPAGPDTVPAWLTVNEAVITEGQQRAIAAALASPTVVPILTKDQQQAVNTGSGNVSVVVNAQGSHFKDRESMRQLAQQVAKELTQQLHTRKRVRSA